MTKKVTVADPEAQIEDLSNRFTNFGEAVAFE